MTHLAMERTSNMLIENALLAVEGNDIKEHLEKIELATMQSNQLFNVMWKVSEPLLYNKEVRIFIQGLFGNQGSIYPKEGLFLKIVEIYLTKIITLKVAIYPIYMAKPVQTVHIIPSQMKLLALVIILTHISQTK